MDKHFNRKLFGVYLTNAGTGDSVGILEVRYIPLLGNLSMRIITPIIS